MDHYNKGDGLQDPYLEDDIEPLALTEGEIDDVVAFLASLTSALYKEQRAFGPKPVRPKPPPLDPQRRD
jgi:cytochrome c peroxidase